MQMKEMKDKLLQFMTREQLSQSQLAELLEIKPPTVSHILGGRNKPGFDLLQKMLLRFPNLNPDWLLTDSGPMYRSDLPQAASEKVHTSSGERRADVEPMLPLDEISPVTEAPRPAVSQPQAEAFSSVVAANPRPSEIERIVLIYADGSFDTFRPKIK